MIYLKIVFQILSKHGFINIFFCIYYSLTQKLHSTTHLYKHYIKTKPKKKKNQPKKKKKRSRKNESSYIIEDLRAQWLRRQEKTLGYNRSNTSSAAKNSPSPTATAEAETLPHRSATLPISQPSHRLQASS